ncbi:MAG: hypothetical protein IKP12_03455 [Acholeplasmatales bacterium]|nr:hypothetical protein [Acholeplasmatales bacterium]
MPVDEVLEQDYKNDLILKHRRLVDEFNKYLPDDKKLSYDENLEKRLNDPKEVIYFNTLNEISNRISKQEKIFQNLIKKFGSIPSDKNIMPRSFIYGLKPEDNEKSRKYNEKLYKLYLEDPDKVLYQRYKRILDFDPSILLKIKDDKQKILDFYLENQALCEDAFVVSSTLTDSFVHLNPNLRKIVKYISKEVESLSHPLMVYKWNRGETYMTFPYNMTKEQALLIAEGNPLYLSKENPLKEKFYPKIDENAANLNGLAGLEKIEANGIEIGPGFFTKYKAFKFDDKKNENVEISLEDAVKLKEKGVEVEIKERTKEERFEINKINRAYEKEFNNIFKKRFANNYDKKEFDLNRLVFKNRGSFIERFFRRTSREYREFIKTFKDYNDPNSKDYLNEERLREKAKLYYDYKLPQGIYYKGDLVGRGRLKFVSAVIKTIDSMASKEEVAREINENIMEDSYKEPAVKEHEVKEEVISNEIIDDINLEKNKNDDLVL